MPSANPPGRLVFVEQEFRKIAAGCSDDRSRAAALGIHESTYARLKRGEIEPGEVVLKAFLARFPDEDIRRVVRYVVGAERPERAA